MRNDVQGAIDRCWRIQQDRTSNQWSPTQGRIAAELNVAGRGQDPKAIRDFSSGFLTLIDEKASRLVTGIDSVFASFGYAPTKADERELVDRLEKTIREDLTYAHQLVTDLATHRGLDLRGSVLVAGGDQLLLARVHELRLAAASRRPKQTSFDRCVSWLKNNVIFVALAIVVIAVAGIAEFLDHAQRIRTVLSHDPTIVAPRPSPTSTLIPSQQPPASPTPTPSPSATLESSTEPTAPIGPSLKTEASGAEIKGPLSSITDGVVKMNTGTMQPRVEGVRVSIEQIPSPRDDAPYAVDVVVQVASSIQPFGVGIICDEEVVEGRFRVVGTSVFTSVVTGYLNAAPKRSYFVAFQSPAVTPSAPLIVTIICRHPFKIESVGRMNP
jgi:hypothetical protein